MHYLRKGSGKALFLLHGFCGSSRTWGPTFDHLGHHFDVIAPDWPGYGDSAHEPPCERIADFAAALIELADQLGIARFSVIGHSVGSFVAQQLMIDHGGRLESAVLYGAGLKMDGGTRFETAEQTIAFLQSAGADATTRKVAATWFVRGERDPAYPASVEAGRGMTVAAGISTIQAARQVDFTTRLPTSTVPALVILGEKERTFSPAMAMALVAALSNGNLCILPASAHAAHLETPDIFNAIVSDALIRMTTSDRL